MSDVPVRGYRLVVRVVLLQLACTALVASLFFCFRGASSGVAGGAVLSRAMYVGKTLQWVWYAAALYAAFAHLKLDAMPLLIGLATAQFGYWAGLIRSK